MDSCEKRLASLLDDCLHVLWRGLQRLQLRLRVVNAALLSLAHVQEKQSHGGEGGGIHRERSEQGGHEPAGEHPPALLPQALSHTVHDAAVLVNAADPICLETGLDDIHGIR